MKIDLFGFQAEGVEQLKSKKSRLIGDDPGLGKTYQGIALDQLNREGDGNKDYADIPKVCKTLVVAPKSVLSTWDEHCMELTENDIYMIDSSLQPAKAREKFLKELTNPKTDGYFLCHWEALRGLQPDISKKKIVFFHIIADEVHRAKNPKAQQTRALKKLRTWYKTGMSGTPADNKPQDLWSVLNWLWPSYYTSLWHFIKAYLIVTEEETPEGGSYRKVSGVNPETIGLLRKEMAPWYIRRRKEDVLPDLPNKYYSRVWVNLGKTQRAAYDEMRKTMVAWVEEHATELSQPLVTNAAVAQLIRLQQFADGYMVPDRDENGEWKFRWKWPKGTKRKDKLEYMKDWAEHHPDEPFDPEEYGAVKVFLWKMTEPAAKLDALMDILEDRMSYNKETGEWEGEQIVIFSVYKQAIKLLEQRLVSKKISHGIYTGDTSEADRTKIRRSFQNGDLRVFAGTIKAGGVGLTLTAASTVIFIDRDWSPSSNGQAEDRLHRIGQRSAVEVIDLMARNTVDLGKKQQLSLKLRHLQMLLGDIVEPELLTIELEKEQDKEGQTMLEGIMDQISEEGDDEQLDVSVDRQESPEEDGELLSFEPRELEDQGQ